jgi:hypothetical protein
MKKLAAVLILGTASAVTACAGPRIPVQVSGHVVVAGSNAPLANHEIEVWVLHEPPIPIAMGSYVKESVAMTEANGAFSLSIEVPKNRSFLLQTSGVDGLPSSIAKLTPDQATMNLTMVHREPGFRK